MYSDLYINKRRNFFIKPLLALLVVAISATGIFLYTQGSVATRASKKNLLEHQIVNVSKGQFGVFWQSDTPDIGWIIYGSSPDKLDQIALDEQDIKSEKQARKYHYALIGDLEPGQEYFYKIISDNELISNNNDAFSAYTLSSTIPSNAMSPIYGKVLNTNNTPAKNAFVIVAVGNSYSLLTFSGNTGEWLLPMQYVVNISTKKQAQLTEETPITIQFFNDKENSMVRSIINKSRPVPQPIVLGNNYSFLQDNQVLSAQDEAPSSTKIASKKRVEVVYPKDDSVIPGTAPLVNGNGVPGQLVTIEISANPVYRASAVVDSYGSWNVPVTVNMAPGKYSINVETKDEAGNRLKFIRDFTLIKSGERVLGETDSTPSATINPSPTILITPTVQVNPTVVVQTITPSPKPTFTPTPVSQITPILTPILSPIYATVTPAPPVSGVNLIPYFGAGVGFIIFVVGAALLI